LVRNGRLELLLLLLLLRIVDNRGILLEVEDGVGGIAGQFGSIAGREFLLLLLSLLFLPVEPVGNGRVCLRVLEVEGEIVGIGGELLFDGRQEVMLLLLLLRIAVQAGNGRVGRRPLRGIGGEIDGVGGKLGLDGRRELMLLLLLRSQSLSLELEAVVVAGRDGSSSKVRSWEF
jgi:hypothetical protein